MNSTKSLHYNRAVEKQGIRRFCNRSISRLLIVYTAVPSIISSPERMLLQKCLVIGVGNGSNQVRFVFVIG